MGNTSGQRRLAAILAADVAEYTRLVERDTDGTVAAWKAARDDVIKPGVEAKLGRIIKFTGDGFLVEFPSVQNAVICAIELQEELSANPLNFRMGVSVGDITDDGGDIHGEGVNIAARLEALAEPGGICVSGDVHNQVRNRVDTMFTDMGEREVKHVSQPVRVFAVGEASIPERNRPNTRKAAKTSIAILPFDNMSNDPEHEYFCDGIVEDIITEISKFRWLMVIARNSTFTYKGKSVDMKTVGAELGARYVVEGSVRRAGNRIRINAQLIDSSDGGHVWAERYDRELDDIFELQDEITRTLVAVIEPELATAESSRARKKPTENMDAWDLVQKASSYRYQFTPENYETALRFLDDAIMLDPEIAFAHALRGYLEYARAIMGLTDDLGEALRRADESARKAIALDGREPLAYQALGSAQFMMRQYGNSKDSLQRAIDLNPNYAQAYFSLALSMQLGADPDGEGIKEAAATGMRLSPKDPMKWSGMNMIGCVYAREGEYETALEHYQMSCRQPVTTYWPFFHLAATLQVLEREREAEKAFAASMDMNPRFSRAKYIQQAGGPWIANPNVMRLLDALGELGLPDE